MDQKPRFVIAILFISHIALSESSEYQKDPNGLRNVILKKREAVHKVNNTLSGSLLKLNQSLLNQRVSDERTLVVNEISLNYDKNEILDPRIILELVVKEMILEARKQINGTISNIPTNSSNCDFSKTSSSYYEEWLNLLKCAVVQLKSGFEETSYSKDTLDHINDWQSVYKILLYQYDQGEKISYSFSEELREQFDIIGIELKALERIINSAESKWSKIKMCVENISSGNIDTAVKYYKEIKKNSVLIDITRAAYIDHGELKNLKNIIDFGNALSTCEENIFVSVTLYYLIKDKNQLSSPYVLIFNKDINHCMKNTPIENSLAKATQEILTSWSSSIHNSNYSDIINFLKTNAVLFRDYYPEIIEKTYTHNVANVKNILNFIRDNSYIEDACIWLRSLFEQMKNNNNLNSRELLMVAYRLKVVMEMPNYQKTADNFKNIAESLKNSFFESVRKLIWNEVTCTIKNKYRNEYLYAPDNGATYDSERRHVFTWRKGGPVVEAGWKISQENNGDYFTIKNTVRIEYLYAAGDSIAQDKDRRNIFLWRAGTEVSQGDWTLIPVDDGNYFAIKNKVHGEYLYAADNDWAWDKDRRRVFTWRGNFNGINEDMKWKIDC